MIPRRPSPGRLTATHNILFTSQIHNYQEQKYNEPESNKHDDTSLGTVESRSGPAYPIEKPTNEVNREFLSIGTESISFVVHYLFSIEEQSTEFSIFAQ